MRKILEKTRLRLLLITDKPCTIVKITIKKKKKTVQQLQCHSNDQKPHESSKESQCLFSNRKYKVFLAVAK